jgi:CHAT domain-containing protein
MLLWLNPLKWWRIFQIKRRWKRSNLQFISAYHQQDWAAAESAARLMVEMAAGAGLRSTLLDSYYSLMLCYRGMGRFDEAIELGELVLELQRSLAANPDDVRVPERLGDLADLYNSAGRVDDAAKLYGQALAMQKRIDGGRGSQRLVNILESLAAVYVVQEQAERAQKLFDEAQGYRRKLGLVANDDELGRAIEQIKSRHKGEHLTDFERWKNLNQEAVKLYESGDIPKAIPIAEQALELAEKLFSDPNKPNNDLATSLNNLAGLYESQGRWAEAEPLYVKALGICNKLFPDPNKPNNDLATSLNNLAGLYRSQGRWAEAEPLFVKALGICNKLFGKNGHPDLVSSLISLAITKAGLQPDSALPLLQQAIKAENHWFTQIIPTNDPQQRLKALEDSQFHLEYLLALTQQHFAQDPAAVANAFNAVLSRKAQAASAEASFNQVIRNYPHLDPKLQQLHKYQQEIATLSYAIGNQPELIYQLNNLLIQSSNLQRQLSKSIPALDLQQQVVDRLALTTILPANSFLIEFIRYDDYDFANSKWLDARYLAFIVEQHQPGVIMLDCGLAEPLKTAIDAFRLVQSNSNFGGQNSNLGDFLRQPIPQNQPPTSQNIVLTEFLDRLLPHLPTNGTCFFAADSHLHILPFHLLKTPDGEYLGDRYQIHYLNTARDLLRRQLEPSVNPPLVLAAPDYDGTSNVSPLQHSHLHNPKIDFQASDGVEEQPFEPLPINKILGTQVAATYQVPCYSGTEATVDRFKQVNAPQLLMIATHGFSLPPQTLLEMLRRCSIDEEENIISKHQPEITTELREFWQKQANQGSEDGQRILAIIDKYGIRPPITDILRTATTDPMLRCGFALAGANIWRFQGVESPQFGKGIIFAQDVMQCNLWGTELALIATCVSGMGEVKNSEGVFGLRRALAIAGAKYVITSLWNIPTKPSALLMEEFFRLYQSGIHPAAALTAAQKYIRNITLGDLKLSSLGQEVIIELQKDYIRQIPTNAPDEFQPLAHPYFWGAWICQG